MEAKPADVALGWIEPQAAAIGDDAAEAERLDIDREAIILAVLPLFGGNPRPERARQRDACIKAGATPAVVAVCDCRLRVGLSDEDCTTLARRKDAVKVSPWNLAGSLLAPGFGGLTVAATIRAASLAGI
ncbi:hypothetical protein B4Q13_24120, partial [Lacticaseibacillus rhamnosus]